MLCQSLPWVEWSLFQSQLGFKTVAVSLVCLDQFDPDQGAPSSNPDASTWQEGDMTRVMLTIMLTLILSGLLVACGSSSGSSTDAFTSEQAAFGVGCHQGNNTYCGNYPP